MVEIKDDSFQNLTFSQREGYEPLPEPMRLEFLSDDLRRELCNVLHLLLIEEKAMRKRDKIWASANILSEYNKKPKDEYSALDKDEDEDSVLVEHYGLYSRILLYDPCNRVLDIIEIIANIGANSQLNNMFKSLFEQHLAAYYLDLSRQPHMFYPRCNKEQGDAAIKAIYTIQENGMNASASYLRKSAAHINAQQYGASIADSIHAVESVARSIDKTALSLDQALDNLEKQGLQIIPALKGEFTKLYGYTSDEQGIRHAVIDKDSPEIGLDEAMFMFGACASFAAYLVSKHQKLNSGS